MPMIGFRLLPETTSQITRFRPQKRVNLMLHPFDRSQTTCPNPPCDPTASIFIADNHTMPPVVTIGKVGGLGLRQDHDIEGADMYQLNGLCDIKPPSIADIEGPNR